MDTKPVKLNSPYQKEWQTRQFGKPYAVYWTYTRYRREKWRVWDSKDCPRWRFHRQQRNCRKWKPSLTQLLSLSFSLRQVVSLRPWEVMGSTPLICHHMDIKGDLDRGGTGRYEILVFSCIHTTKSLNHCQKNKHFNFYTKTTILVTLAIARWPSGTRCVLITFILWRFLLTKEGRVICIRWHRGYFPLQASAHGLRTFLVK